MHQESSSTFENKTMRVEAPIIPPFPNMVENVRNAVIDLNDLSGGTWEFLFSPVEGIPAPGAESEDFNLECLPREGWKPVAVPGELAMQGFDIENNIEYYYQRDIIIPEDFEGKRILIRFDGVYSNGRCWIDGHFIRCHTGGFTSWDCDITDYVKAGKSVRLTVGVADLEGSTPGNYNPDGKLKRDPSWASFYAHHNIGGILRDVSLIALPKTYLARMHIHTKFDEHFRDAQLKINTRLAGELSNAVLRVELTGDDGRLSAQQSVRYISNPDQEIILQVKEPKHWDAEHPNLYTLNAFVEQDGNVQEVVKERVGFREICYGGKNGTDANKLYVNGKEIKLRGTCRHDVSPRGGRSTTRQEDWEEIRAYRNSNINHIRTSHYPPSRHLLEACDVLGMYVEEENGACFQGDNGRDIYAGPEDFLIPFTEMVERDRNHPCVIIWSLGNESGFERTEGYRQEYDYIKAVDVSRPVIFSYPYTVETLPLPYDICSRHYESEDGILGGMNMPVLHDEFAHIACYNLDELKRDPNVRNFWGRGLKFAWEKIFTTSGALGADLWGGIDDVFPLPENVGERWQSHSKGMWHGYGEWGSVLDCYRRLKPEAYLTKKAYSPVRLDEQAVLTAGDSLLIPVKNWFDHTDFSELCLYCSVDGVEQKIDTLPHIAPHEEGILTLKGDWNQRKEVMLTFYLGEQEIDSFLLHLNKKKINMKENADDAVPQLRITDHEIQVICGEVRYRFSKREGCMIAGEYKGRVLLAGGPVLHLNGIEVPKWTATRAPYAAMENGHALVVLQGSYGELFSLQMIFRIFGNGRMDVEYQIRKASLDTSALSEIGLSFELPDDVSQVQWEREGLYSIYPEDHIGRNCGTADREFQPALQAGYGASPTWEWKDDMYDAFLSASDDSEWRAATSDFKAMRENFWSYTVRFTSGAGQICAISDADAAARIELKGKHPQLIVNQQWCYPELAWGNDTGRAVQLASGGARGEVCLMLGAEE